MGEVIFGIDFKAKKEDRLPEPEAKLFWPWERADRDHDTSPSEMNPDSGDCA